MINFNGRHLDIYAGPEAAYTVMKYSFALCSDEISDAPVSGLGV